MKYLIAVLMFAPTLAVAATVTGHSDLSVMPAILGAQSFTSVDQAIGVQKPLFHMEINAQPALNLGLFVGGKKPLLSSAGDPTTFLGGITVCVPGSLLDFALGTKMGDTWIPRLKTGILLADDLTRPNAMHLNPTFAGLLGSYTFGN